MSKNSETERIWIVRILFTVFIAIPSLIGVFLLFSGDISGIRAFITPLILIFVVIVVAKIGPQIEDNRPELLESKYNLNQLISLNNTASSRLANWMQYKNPDSPQYKSAQEIYYSALRERNAFICGRGLGVSEEGYVLCGYPDGGNVKSRLRGEPLTPMKVRLPNGEEGPWTLLNK